MVIEFIEQEQHELSHLLNIVGFETEQEQKALIEMLYLSGAFKHKLFNEFNAVTMR
ncbi:MAG: hypothetical protein MTP17_04625 [Candidatus Midichloria sp.]|nr:MAG: hypothetical protein MTP17_04625 [Candidatus Midichloria sp.]